MDSITNPYTPNAGARPDAMVGREEQTAAFGVLLQRLEVGRTSQSLIVRGLRGVGKTVPLNELREIAERRSWKVVELEASKFDESVLRRTLATQLKAALLQLSPRAKWSERFEWAGSALTSFSLAVDLQGTWSLGWSVPSTEGVADHGDLALDLTDVFLELGRAAEETGRGIVISVDEVQFLKREQLEGIIQAVYKTVQRKLPITFVGAGIPQIAELAGDAKSYAERLFKFPEISALTDADAAAAFADPARNEGVEWDDNALKYAIAMTRGYPYFIQELGHEVWEVATGDRITLESVHYAIEAYEAKLDSSFFRVRLDRATPLQTAYMRAMAQLGAAPQKAADVAGLMGRESAQVAPTRAELIDMGLLYTPEHGYAAFTVPDFDKFMLRAVPNLEVPPIRKRRSTQR
ncbi:ATP-binding protein [Leucobacter sp. 7(1)]|uniref:ATP-binding protein n=1 Tax=Leucobacter sp. 7(1) TaxID=1255613 RepID=UPI000B35433A|nr:ATP-binding protein [Leucobacter sp. 7(1)]